MEFLTDLWLPILVSAILVFVASSVIHMLLPIHKCDYKKFPNEADILDFLGKQNIPRGTYMFPGATGMKEASTPEMIAKFEKGPCGFTTILPSGVPSMGKSLLQWFILTVVIGIFAAYTASIALGTGPADYMVVFRITGTVATMAYALSNVTDSIWKGVGWGITVRFIFDGIVYGLVTAGTFGWLWPSA